MIWLILLATWSVAEMKLDSPKFSYLAEEEIANGAKAFSQSCYSCHSMSYMRTDPVSLEGGIDPENTPMWDENSWNGHPPPDLSLITAAKGIDYVYSYLKGYYKDENHPNGYENYVMPGTQMPNPFALMQGDQVLVDHPDATRMLQQLILEKRGSMSPQAFDDYIASIVHYLDYASDPHKAFRHKVGFYVLGFLAVMILIMIGLDLAYWQKIHDEHVKE